ncbi:hypothetical protein ACH5RR_005697 [Cinchona calisaya]|uniref:Uncharacterized protein n=1 Tax=Cinchona calisaya TaxID=153742 RepID=A0ABD3AM54_9GENT
MKLGSCSHQFCFLLSFGLVQVLIKSNLSPCTLKLRYKFVFPGTYVSNYSLHWNLMISGEQEGWGLVWTVLWDMLWALMLCNSVARRLSLLQLVPTSCMEINTGNSYRVPYLV